MVVHTTWTLHDEGAVCRAVQEVVIDAPFVVAPFVFSTAERAHEEQVEKTRALLEGARDVRPS